MLLALVLSAAIAAPSSPNTIADGLTADANGMLSPVVTLSPADSFASARSAGSGDDGKPKKPKGDSDESDESDDSDESKDEGGCSAIGGAPALVGAAFGLVGALRRRRQA